VSRIFKIRFSKPGSAPGVLTAPAERRVEEVKIDVFDYAPDHLEERRVDDVEELFPYRDSPGVTWIDVVGVHDVEMLRRLGEHYRLHPLALEDVVNVGQRPKQEEYESNHFIVMKMVRLSESLELEQISIFLGQGYVITLQEIEGDVFGPVRERIRHGKGRIRKMGADYLTYALLDALVDQLFPVLEDYGERMEELEDELLEEPTDETLQKIHAIKREFLQLRRVAWPQREVIKGLDRQESPLVTAETKLFLRDCYDHSIQVMDMLEGYRDLATGMLDVYLSSVSNRMNEVMKVLTVIASIFIPLTFFAGIYGMNFDPEASPWNMPELGWAYGYPMFWGMIVVMAVGLIWLFRRRGWL